MMNYIQLKGSEAQFAWPKLGPMLERVVEITDGEFSVEDLRQRILMGLMTAFVAHDGPKIKGLAVAEAISYPQFSSLRVVAAVGEDIKEWIAFEANLENLAACMGCSYIEGFVRPGMAKLCVKIGYTPRYTLIRKPVHKERH